MSFRLEHLIEYFFKGYFFIILMSKKKMLFASFLIFFIQFKASKWDESQN